MTTPEDPEPAPAAQRGGADLVRQVEARLGRALAPQEYELLVALVAVVSEHFARVTAVED